MSWLWAIPGAAALFFCLICAAVCVCAHRRREVHAADCIVVLGAKVHADGHLSRTLLWRCDRAWELWRDGLSDELILCGGRGGDEPCAEAQSMVEYLHERGVPGAQLHREDASVNTVENLRNASRIMAAHGWHSAIVVTSDYHLQRALWLARDLGMNACGAAAKSNPRLRKRVKARLRESVSWMLYFVRKI
ncbi:MAG: YdcF family protein [Clostridia bacterium]|nr:YdcF family protein [Clostridia bacterium]